MRHRHGFPVLAALAVWVQVSCAGSTSPEAEPEVPGAAGMTGAAGQAGRTDRAPGGASGAALPAAAGAGGRAAAVDAGAGSGNAGGAGGIGGNAAVVSAVPDAGSGADITPPRTDTAVSAPYACSLILGIATTREWFGAGFEKVVDNARWEIMFQDSAHIEKWADPQHAVWSLPKTSPCTAGANTPDRIVFNATNYDYRTVELFLPKYVAVINNIKAKYPSARRVDVMTFTRAPGNTECTAANRPKYSVIAPAQDEAVGLLVKMFPDFVFAAPKWEVKSCAEFTLCPHLTGPANAAIAKTIGEHFLAN